MSLVFCLAPKEITNDSAEPLRRFVAIKYEIESRNSTSARFSYLEQQLPLEQGIERVARLAWKVELSQQDWTGCRLDTHKIIQCSRGPSTVVDDVDTCRSAALRAHVVSSL